MTSKYDDGDCKEEYFDGKADDKLASNPVNINVLSIEINPSGISDISAPLDLQIRFELDRDCLCSQWIIKFLVDSCDKRLIRVTRNN